MSKPVLVVGAALVAVSAVVLLLWEGAVPVSVATVAPDTLTVTVTAEGQTRARHRFTIVAPITGRVGRIELEDGDSVALGDLLANIYPAPQDPAVVASLRAETDAATARYRQAEAGQREASMQADQARTEVERRRPLAEMGAITAERLEQAELAAVIAEQRLEAMEAEVASALASLQSARARLQGAESADTIGDPIELRAPVAGRVAELVDPSERVVAAGTPLLSLADVGGMEAVFDVLSEDAVRIDRGNDVVITGWGGDETLEGRVRTVTGVGYTKVSTLGVEEQRVDVIADLTEPPPTLGTGYRVSGEVIVWRGRDVLSVPTSALFRRGGSWQAFIVLGDRARLRSVEIGHRNERAAEVVEGLSEGDRVILFPPEDVEDGARVQTTSGSGS